MTQPTADVAIDPADGAISLGPLAIRFRPFGEGLLVGRTRVRRALLPLAALLIAAIPLGLRPSAAFAAPTCFGKPATHVMHEGDPAYAGTSGDDVVVGSGGPDTIDLSLAGGTDLACGGGGDDYIVVGYVGSKADGGAGRDEVHANWGALARGGSGDDVFVYAEGLGGRAEGGSGDDRVQGGNGTTADGGSGDDTVWGYQAVALYGGSGSDSVFNMSGTPATRIDCGSSYDLVYEDGSTDVRRCEGTALLG